MADGQTLNIPQLLAFMLISALAIRYFFFSPASHTSTSGNNNSSTSSVQAAPGRRVDERHVATLQAMFPQLDRRAILWDLMRNGGSVQATSERVLAGPGLDTPPQSFQPPPAPNAAPSNRTGLGTQQGQQRTGEEEKAKRPDLITRYGLGDKVREEAGADEADKERERQKAMWSSNKSERQALLQRRKEQMILEARRKLEARERERDERGKGKASVR